MNYMETKLKIRRNERPDIAGPVTETGDNIELLRRFARGDDAAFEKIYMQWFDPIFHLLKRLTGSAEDAQDITQDIFGKLWEKRGSIDVKKGVKSYLFSAARHSASNMAHKNRSANNYIAGTNLSDADDVTSYDLAVAHEIELATEYVICRMPKQRRRVYEYSYKYGLSPSEIASKLNLTPRVVHDHLYQARLSIKEMLPAIILSILLNV
jgi:RNA polymerase sigma-70 factor (ECF subfamily)